VFLKDGEEIIRRSSACVSMGLYNSWKPISLVLTDRRLLFCQPPSRAIFGASLHGVAGVVLVRRRFILGLRRKQLCISFRTGRRYVAVNKPEEWLDAIMEAKSCAKVRWDSA